MSDARTEPGSAAAPPCLLYCHCAYAKVVPEATKREVLSRLSDSGVAFDAVADLCEMSARKDPALRRIAASGGRVAACFPRAVTWLFHAAGTPLDETVEVLNMREESAEAIVERMLAPAGAPPASAEEAAAAVEPASAIEVAE